MAKVYDAPSNPFKKAITHGIAAPHTGSSGGAKEGKTGSENTKLVGNPFAGELGNPAINQTFSGTGASVAQLGQTLAQNAAFNKQQANTQDALASLQSEMQKGSSPTMALMNILKDNPSHMLSLPKDLIGFLQQAQNASQVGQTQTFDMGGGNKIGMVMGPDGKPHFMNMPNAPQQNADTAARREAAPKPFPGTVGPNGGVGVLQGGVLGESTDLRSTSNVNAEANRDAAAQRQAVTAAKPRWDGAQSRWVYPPGADGKPSTVPVEGQVVKMNSAETQFFSTAPQLYQALGDLHDLSNAVAGPVTGKIRTLSGRVLGENEAGTAWNSARAAAENAIAGMGNAGGGYVAGMKTRLGNLPKDWQSATQNKSLAKAEMQGLQGQVATHAAALEGTGMLPDAVSDGMTKMGVFTKKFAPAFSKLRSDPATMTPDEMRQLSNQGPHLAKEDREMLKQEIIKRTGAAAGQATQPGGSSESPEGEPGLDAGE